MSATGPVVTLSPRDYDAVLFDLDGVLTNTASVHAAAWKKLFDEFLERRAARSGEQFVPFDSETDYWRYVDGKSRLDGVTAFLASRAIDLPFGVPTTRMTRTRCRRSRGGKTDTSCSTSSSMASSATKRQCRLVEALRAHDVKTAVVSSSRNCATVLEAAGIAHLFDMRVDGLDLERARPCWQACAGYVPRSREGSRSR